MGTIHISWFWTICLLLLFGVILVVVGGYAIYKGFTGLTDEEEVEGDYMKEENNE